MAAIDNGGDNTMDHPARNSEVVTPSDTADLTNVSRALYVGTGGDVEVNMLGVGAAIVFVGVPSGALLPIRVTRVLNGNTGASNIVSLW